MKFIGIITLISIILFSCKKDDVAGPSFSEARYRITVTGKWTAPDFGVPAGAHYTTFVGMIHNSMAILWKDGARASAGTELLAEIGNGTTMLAEIDSMINARNASSLILFLAPPLTGSISANIYTNTNYSFVSFASMLAPTPDWFIGVSGIDLYRNGNWIADTAINLYALDAGTEDGDMFGYNNPVSVPQQNIHVLQPLQATVLANGNPALAAIATVRFIKQ